MRMFQTKKWRETDIVFPDPMFLSVGETDNTDMLSSFVGFTEQLKKKKKKVLLLIYSTWITRPIIDPRFREN